MPQLQPMLTPTAFQGTMSTMPALCAAGPHNISLLSGTNCPYTFAPQCNCAILSGPYWEALQIYKHYDVLLAARKWLVYNSRVLHNVEGVMNVKMAIHSHLSIHSRLLHRATIKFTWISHKEQHFSWRKIWHGPLFELENDFFSGWSLYHLG